jgi:hypothetical protein
MEWNGMVHITVKGEREKVELETEEKKTSCSSDRKMRFWLSQPSREDIILYITPCLYI